MRRATCRVLLSAAFATLATTAGAAEDHKGHHGSPSVTATKTAHGHGHAFSYSLGLSVTKLLGEDEGGDGMAMEVKPATGLSLLHGDDDHAAGSGDSGHSKSSGVDPMLMAMVSYRALTNVSLDLMVGTMVQAGLTDPTAGPSLSVPLGPATTSVSSLYASAPVSKMSQDMYKLTTVTATTGVTQKIRRATALAAVEYSMSWYKETLVDEDEAAVRATPGALALADDDMAGMDMGGESGGSMDSDQMKVAMMGEREFSHIGVTGGGYYDLSGKLRLRSDAKAKRIQHQFAAPSWQTSATVVDATYALGGNMSMGLGNMPMGFAVDGALGLIKSSPSPSVPSVPLITVGVSYGGM